MTRKEINNKIESNLSKISELKDENINLVKQAYLLSDETQQFEEKTLQTVTIKHRYCDICGSEVTKLNSCTCCGKDICLKCVGYSTNDSDYPDYYCVKCWNIGKPYRKKIRELEQQIDNINQEWLVNCKDLDIQSDFILKLNKSKNIDPEFVDIVNKEFDNLLT